MVLAGAGHGDFQIGAEKFGDGTLRGLPFFGEIFVLGAVDLVEGAG